MANRQVRQLMPLPADEDTERPRTFSEFIDQPNIVLLGDPGAGKTHLFRSFTAAADGIFFTVRNFLNSPPVPDGATLFIDALDEKRAGRGDDDAIDGMVQKLFASPPGKVRISCRERDWLGASDLAAFQLYFDQHSGVIVLSLQALSVDEQKGILLTQGIDDPDAFLNEAAQRGLEDFLTNPQNLIMLAQVVRSGDWPKTRSELFETFTRLLLTEHNPERARAGEGVYGADELRATAGAACAVRLISDVAGISLSDQNDNPDYPSYRTIGLLDSGKIRAALGRRVFTTAGEQDTVDYIHRTTAEYLAAAWLAQRICGGLPIGRLRSLIGIDGHPAAELRGLHAWLAVFLPEHADQLIDADPYGVLTYGDAASLSPSLRWRLLEALSRLSQIDPWFRAGNWSSERLGGLSSPEMVDAFREILNSSASNFSLRSIVFDALAAGTAIPELKDDLIAVLVRGDAPYAERHGALAGLLDMGEFGKEAIVSAYHEQLGSDAPAIRLRGEIISALYRDPFTPSDVAVLLVAALNCTGELPTGGLWSLSNRISLADIPAILDRFEPPDCGTRSSLSDRRKFYNVAYVIDRLLLRFLQEAGESSASKLWRWLCVRRAIRNSYTGRRSDEISQAFKQRRDLLLRLVDEAVAALTVNEHRWRFVHDLRDSTLHAIDGDDLLERIAAHVEQVEHGTEKEAFLYELALVLSYNESPRAIRVFERLYALADERPDLAAIRDDVTVVEIQEWRTERSLRSAREEAEEQEGMARNIRQFEANEAAIRSGSHLGWLSWVAQIYFGHFLDSDEAANPVERLRRALGPEKTLSAIEGLIAVPQRADIPSLDTVARMAAEHRHYDWWYAVIAGLDEKWKQNPSLVGWNDDLLRVALAIDLANPTFEREDNTVRQCERGWKMATIESRPSVVRDAYVTLADAGLSRGEQNVHGLRELLNDDALAPFRREIAFRFLSAYPNASPYRLQELLESASGIVDARGELISIARDILHGTIPIDEGNHDQWLITAYFASPQEFQDSVASRAAAGPEIVWLMRDMTGYRRSESEQAPALSIGQLEFGAGIAAQHFPNASHPSGGWSGDRNAWDGAEFVGNLVNQISADPTEAATSALSRLESDNRLATYRDQIKHALASQQTRRRESEFLHPNWEQTVAALSNGAPANVADLHAILMVNLKDNRTRIASANNDIYKRFWNEDSYGRVENPKSEESCCNVLIDFLRASFQPLGVIVEPEGHMAADRRADISVSLPGQKIPVELKRDYHADVWSAAETQLDRFYTRDPEASGFGVYGVFWFGNKRPRTIPQVSDGQPPPRSAAEMENMLRALIPHDKRARIAVLVIDVSGEVN